MNDFVNVVQSNNLGHLLEIRRFENFRPKGNDELTSCLLDIVRNNLKVMIDPDTDPDGFFAALCVKETLVSLGHKNYTINSHQHKRHGITNKEVVAAINENYDYVIIVDSSTNSMEYISTLTRSGVKVIIIDHHQTRYTSDEYPEGALVINCAMKDIDFKSIGQDYSKLSACALVAILMNNTLEDMGHEPIPHLMLYAYITLYSDSCDLDSLLNISIIFHGEMYKNLLPEWIKKFMNQWDSLNRTFVEFKLVPRINALIRQNHFDMVHLLFFKTNELAMMVVEHLYVFIENNYKLAKDTSTKLAQLAEVTQYNKFVIADIDNAIEQLGLERTLARNFTGLVASKVMQEYGKTTMLLMDMGRRLEGSVRDPFNRDVLKVFRQFLRAEGHKPAFGVSLTSAELPFVIENLNMYDDMLELNESKSIIIDGDRTEDIDLQINLMGQYNEFSGGSIPVAYMKKTVTSDCVVQNRDNYTNVRWGERKITSFSGGLYYQDVMIMKPTKKANGFDLIVNNVL